MIQELLPNVFLVPLPEDAHSVGIVHGSPNYLYFDNLFGHDGSCEKQLPPGSYKLLFCSKDITEELAAGVVETTSITKVDIDMNPIAKPDFTYWVGLVAHPTALSAFHSLLSSHNLNVWNYCVIKKEK